MTPEQQQQLEELMNFKKSLENSWSIPLAVDQALRGRFTTTMILSNKTATSENQTVSEAGGGTYPVMSPPDGFMQFVIKGVTYYIPYFT